MGKCFACDKKFISPYAQAVTIDGQVVFVGPECWRKIVKAWKQGTAYQPPLGGPTLTVYKGS